MLKRWVISAIRCDKPGAGGYNKGGYDGDARPGTGLGTGIFTADRTLTG
jgi:hypothetical protein